MKQGHQDMKHKELKQAQTTVEFLLGPIKIKDGLFFGDQLAAKDIEFIISNKVTHIINTVSKAVPNLYERFGVQYLSVHWAEKEENIFDKKNNSVNAIYEFIEEAMDMGESCLIHSMHGKSRAAAVLCAYIMRKYGWTLNKVLELVNSKKEGLEIRNNYLRQMQDLEKRLMEGRQLSDGWGDAKTQQELLLANTYRNSKKAEPIGPGVKKNCRKKLVWDEKLVYKAPNTMSSTMGRFSSKEPPNKVVGRVKSILKGCPNPGEDEATPVKRQFKLEGEDKMVNNINGNIVHVTVNNFITTEKKPVDSTSKVYNSRPYSSDTKDREKKGGPYDVKTSKMFGYDTFSSNLKSAYEQKIMGKTSSGAGRAGKKKEQIKGYMAHDRPSSANNSDEVKKPKPLPFASMGREEMMVTGSSGIGAVGKRRLPSGGKNDQRFK